MGKETKEKVPDVEKSTTKTSTKSKKVEDYAKAQEEKTKKSSKKAEVLEEKVEDPKIAKQPKTKNKEAKEVKVEETKEVDEAKSPISNFLNKIGLTKLSAGILAGTMSTSIALGVAGVALASGKKGSRGKSAYEIAVENGFTGSEAEWLASLKGATGAQGPEGTGGAQGPQGTSSYIDYNGNVWVGDTKTDLNFKLEYNDYVFDNTLAVAGEMSRYFTSTYLDVSENTIALMSHFKPNAEVTVYSGATVSLLSVIAEEAGTLRIGTAKVADVVASRTTGATFAANTTSYNVVAGQNDIELNLVVGADETIVLGGAGSTAKLYSLNNFENTDEAGNYSLIDGDSHADIISTTGGSADTLAIKVVCECNVEESVFGDSIKTLGSSGMAIVNDSAAPFVYDNRTLFAGKTIKEIGIYVRTLEADVTVDQTMTVYIVNKNATSNYSSGTPITVTVPASEFAGTSKTAVNKWVYATDFKTSGGQRLDGITLNDNQTLAFGASTGDTINWGYSATKNNDYLFTTNSGSAGNASLIFDIKIHETKGLEYHLDNIAELEDSAVKAVKEAALKQVLNCKNLSILGDSISTFSGWSNNATTTNSTIGSNALYYTGSNHGITDVNMTYWKKVANATGMNVLVDNAWSGDRVTTRGQTRCEELHDDTGNPDNGVINPDVIIVYLGINDFNNGVTVDTFTTSYDTMIGKIKTKYANADIFVCTLVPNLVGGSFTADENTKMLAYNNAIKAAATKYGATVVDFYTDSGITADNCSQYMSSSDSQSLHPNETGMTLMANTIWRTMYNKYIGPLN